MNMQGFEEHPPESLIPSKGNARTHSKRQIRMIASSIERFGFTNVVLIDEDLRILAGHGRVEAAKLLGLKTVPCRRLSHLTETEKRAYVLADNQLATKAGWDKELRAIELEYLIDAGFDLGAVGFEIAEVDFALAEDRGAKTDDHDRVPDVRSQPVTETNDVWRLGAHRLVCGDARKAASYDRLMGDEVAQLVFTDPPYNVPIDKFVGGKGKIQHREFAMGAGEMSDAQFVRFLEETLGLAAKHSADGSIHYVCMDWRHVFELSLAGRTVYGAGPKNIIAWVKDNGGMGTFYRSRHELIFAFKKGDAQHINNFELGQTGRSRTNVWEYAGVNSMRKGRLEELAMHPTVKPLALVADALRDCSRPKGLVLDPFGGSGTTLIAAEQTGRVARVLELDPLYCDVVVRRWQKFTGKCAYLGDSQYTFDEIEGTFGGVEAAR